MMQRRYASLVEILFCLAMIAMLGNFLVITLHQLFAAQAQSERHSRDVLSAMQAGERWRMDVRSAIVPPYMDGATFIVPRLEGEIAWRFRDGRLERRQGEEPWTPLMNNLERCHVLPIDAAADAPRAWRCEIVIKSRRNKPQVIPRFSFIAVHRGDLP